MLFNSIDFAIFLPIVFLLYWFVFNKSLKVQNLLLIAAGYVFYGWWDYRFLSLILFSTLVDYFIGILLFREKNNAKRKMIILISIIVNFTFLGFFKYYNFFVDNFTAAFSFFGSDIKLNSLHIILPVGISFYTFQSLTYTIDVYKGKLEPTRDLITFAAFVCFFPQLAAGPIERAAKLLPQFLNKRTFNYNKATDGMRQILWGLFKKMVVADNFAEYANHIFNNSSTYSGATLILGAVYFTFQIYCDFSGYSDIALGTARLFGFDLMRNFAFPYFSRDIAEFWRRWHISLSTWFRDYLYIPLGGSKGGMKMKIRNTFIIFIVSGFWHGANWTFIVWGAVNALYFLPLLVTNNNRNNMHIVAEGKIFPSGSEAWAIFKTFSITVFAWIFFRAENISHAYHYIINMFTGLFDKDAYLQMIHLLDVKFGYMSLFLIAIFMTIEWLGREGQYAIAHIFENWPAPLRYAMYYLIIIVTLWFGGKEQQFIYFQF